MRRTLTLTVMAGMLLAAVAPAVAGDRAEHRGRFSPRTARAGIEQRLAMQQARTPEVEYSTPYLPVTYGNDDVDARIRRLGELIRRQDPAQP